MGIYMNPGNEGFAAIRKGKYVDKTGMIAFINHTLGTMDKLTCVSRPRRFGKSFTAQMLCAYYDRSCDSEKLFEGLEISKDESFREHLNKYHVIYLDLTLFIAMASDKKNIVREIKECVAQEVRENCPGAQKGKSLFDVLFYAAKSTGIKFIIIIDEWDALFREAKNDGKQQEEYIQLLRGLFKSSLTNRMIEAAYMTGILPIKKYGTQSAMTDFREYTMLFPQPLEKYTGFTEKEVRKLCADSGMEFEDVRKWYDGYVLGNGVHIYSPQSVMDAVSRGCLGNYWTQSETYESLRLYIDLDEDGLKEAVVQMIGGARCRIDAGTFQNDMINIKSKDDVLTLLVHLGYLAYDADEKSVYIPNEELRQEFVRAAASGRHKEVVKLIQNSDLLLEQTLNMEEEAVAEAIENAHNAGTAPLFYNNEQALRSVIRFAYISCADEFFKIEELPSGRGYADVVFFPKRGSAMPVLLIELKWDKTQNSAIRQIKNRKYPQVLQDYGGEILLVGISYSTKTGKHSCRIEKYMP